MQLLISDTNILIDMATGELLERMFELSYGFAVPGILFEEELRAHHEDLLELGLECRPLDGQSMLRAQELRQKYPGTSTNDCLALALAGQASCPLLTGDRVLREAARKEACVVMGTLWLVSEMITQNIIDQARAHHAYRLMKARGRRLPWSLTEKPG